MTILKRTPIYEEHIKLGAKIVDFASWEMPIQYEGITDEHLTVRNHVGLFDVSHMGEILVTGQEAIRFINKLVTNDVTKIKDNQVMYTLMCYEDGGIVDDLLVYRFNEEKFLLVVNASNIDQDFDWILNAAKSFRVQVENQSNYYGQVAIQGKKAQAVLKEATKTNLDEIKFFYFLDDVEINGIKCLVSRTGYTGEDGFEIYAKSDQIVNIWRTLLNVGEAFGIKPIGLGARDTLRFEASLPLYGNEISKEITPLEAGLGFFIKLDTDFIGRDALREQKEQGLTRKLVGLELHGKGIPRHGYPVLNEAEEEIGVITTGYMLPGHENPLALALININYTTLGEEIKIKIRKRLVDTKVVSKKFINKNYKK
ncbi:glycine cleavage system aminomethyltransferase GcvT [Haloplasma contractile]|uniref:Aminomethyltransferase n=1 Tax=Haloplasma contractile SSD-17B TaxID=1033810 RepID=U2FSH7_9MOLU|nr:Glycine cleavage system T protein Amino acid transport [Haloplasma contractile SSD-17B]